MTIGIYVPSRPQAGALRNGVPIKDWVLSEAMERLPRKLAGADNGNRQIVNCGTYYRRCRPTLPAP